MRDHNVAFSKMAADVDAKLQQLRDCEQDLTDAEAELGAMRAKRDNARIALEQARDELFEAHPELRPAPTTEGQEKLGFELVEVDDPNELPDFDAARDVPVGLEFRERG